MMSALISLRERREQRYQSMCRRFVDENRHKINRKLDLQEGCAELVDIVYRMNMTISQIRLQNPTLQGCDTKRIRMFDMNRSYGTYTDIVYLYNSYVLAEHGVYLLVRQHDDGWMAQKIEDLVMEIIEEVDGLNLQFILQHPYKWNKAPIFYKILQALQQLVDE